MTDSKLGEASSSIDRMRNDIFECDFDDYSDQSEGYFENGLYFWSRSNFRGGDIDQSSAGCSSSDAEFELALVNHFFMVSKYFSAGDEDFDDDGSLHVFLNKFFNHQFLHVAWLSKN